jgi:hypothetical protein
VGRTARIPVESIACDIPERDPIICYGISGNTVVVAQAVQNNDGTVGNFFVPPEVAAPAAPSSTPAAATTTQPADPLTAAMVAAGFPAPSPEAREAFETLCTAFGTNQVDVINQIAADPATAQGLAVAFGVLCPPQAARVGVAVMGNGDPVFAGYPLIVDVGTIDSRVANSFEGELVDGQVVALAPGVYTPFNPDVPNLISYLNGPNAGDCVMRDQFFPNSGGSCWEGVQAGSAEPPTTESAS